jgi:hypothetical protein
MDVRLNKRWLLLRLSSDFTTTAVEGRKEASPETHRRSLSDLNHRLLSGCLLLRMVCAASQPWPDVNSIHIPVSSAYLHRSRLDVLEQFTHSQSSTCLVVCQDQANGQGIVSTIEIQICALIYTA